MHAPALQAANVSLSMRCIGSMPTRITTGENRKWNLKVWASFGAGAAGVALCASQPSRAEASAGATSLPPFSLEGSKHDKSTFWGRTQSMYELIDPRNLLVTADDITKAKQLLEDYKKNGKKAPAGVTEEELWNAKTTIDINVHPVTGETLWVGGRMSAFVPCNVPVILFMTVARGAPMIALSQWTNQTYNAVCNYVNRSGESIDMTLLGQSYGLAVTSAILIAITGRKLVDSIKALQSLGVLVPYTAVALAGSANVGFTRMDEWNGRGVPLCDEDGKELGFSLAGGKAAVTQTVLTRSCLLPVVPMILPGMVVNMLGLKSFVAATTVELILIAAAIGVMLPMVLAVLPQKMELDVKDLEPEFQNLYNAKGEKITKVYGNKGL